MNRWLIVLGLLLVPRIAQAHGLPPTRVALQAESRRYVMQIQLPLIGLGRMFPTLADAGSGMPLEQRRTVVRAALLYVQQHISLERAKEICTARWKAQGVSATHFLVEALWDCPGSGALTLRADPLFEISDTARVYLHLTRMDGSESTMPLFPGRSRATLMAEPESQWQMMRRFVAEGARHILGGLDHLLFLLGLILVSGTLRRLAWAVTGFTLGHTATLLIVATIGRGIATGLFSPLIALSIVYIGYEAWYNLQRSGEALLLTSHIVLWLLAMAGMLILPTGAMFGLLIFVLGFGRWLAFGGGESRFGILVFPVLFGLLHGMGFAGPMLDLQLRGWDLLLVVLGFNIGVECGQFFLIGTALLFLYALWRLWEPSEVQQKYLSLAAALFLMVSGSIWFVARAIVRGG